MAKRCRTCCAAAPIIGTLCVKLLDCQGSRTGLLDGSTVTLSGPGSVTNSPGTASRGVESVAVTNAGTGYSSPATATLTGGGGTGAATSGAALFNGTIASVPVTAGGSGYTRIPTVSANIGTGASLTAVLTPTSVGTIAVTNGGSGYTEATVAITGGGGSGATADVLFDVDIVESVVITNGGSGYTGAPITVTITGDGSGATATATITPTSVASVAVNAGGTGYGESSTVSITNTGGGSGTLTRVLLSNARVNQVNIATQGTDYTSAPAVTIAGAGGTGSGATATATLTVPQVCFGYTATGNYSNSVTPPATALGARFAPIAAQATGFLLGGFVVNINASPGPATGYRRSKIFPQPLTATLVASTAAGTITLAAGAAGSTTWTGCNDFAWGGDAAVSGTSCVVGGSGNTPATITFTNPTTLPASIAVTVAGCCAPASGATAVPHFRRDVTCASGAGGFSVTPSAITVVSTDPPVFTVTVPTSIQPCIGSTNALSIPIGGTVTFTE